MACWMKRSTTVGMPKGRVLPSPFGISTRSTTIRIYMLSTGLATLAGIVFSVYTQAGYALAGVGVELDAIASCYIGGTSSRGGVGTVYGALIGATIMASLDNGMSMLGVEAFWQMVVKGVILLTAVWVDVISGAGSDR